MVVLTFRKDVKVDRCIEKHSPSNNKVVEISTRQLHHSKNGILAMSTDFVYVTHLLSIPKYSIEE